MITVFFGIEIFLHFIEEANERVSYVSHLFGAIFGFLMALCVLKNACSPATKKKLILIILFYEIFIFIATIYNFIIFSKDNLCPRECAQPTGNMSITG